MRIGRQPAGERRVAEPLTFHSGVGLDTARAQQESRKYARKNLESSNMHTKTIGIALALALLPMTAVAQSAGPQTAAPEAREKVRAACAADVVVPADFRVRRRTSRR